MRRRLDSTLKIADAQIAAAKATRLAGEAEAAAIKARGNALRDNPSLVGLTKPKNSMASSRPR